MGVKKIILASTSPFRRELLERLGLEFMADTPDFDEGSVSASSPAGLSELRAVGKARSLAARYPDALIIGSDQVADLDGELLGKAGDEAGAVAQLTRMSGNTVHFHTGLALVRGEEQLVRSELFIVHLKPLTQAQIVNYVRHDKPFGCAGSFMIEGLGVALMRGMEGRDYTSLIGLPLILLTEMLEELGVEVL